MRIGTGLVTLLLLIFGPVAPDSITAQSRSGLKSLGVEDGLPSSRIQTIFQDSRDYLWIATDAGLVRFDGLQLESFGLDAGLPALETRILTEDGLGRIWALTTAGLVQYHNGSAPGSFKLPAELESVTVSSILGAESGLLILEDESVMLFGKQGAAREVLPPAGYPWFRPKAVSNRNGLAFLLDGAYGESPRLIAVQDDRAEIVAPELDGLEQGSQIHFLGDTALLYASAQGWMLHPIGIGTSRSIARLPEIPDVSLLDKDDRLWWSSGNSGGILRSELSIADKGLELKERILVSNDLADQLLQDIAGNIWYAVEDDGLRFLGGKASHVVNKREPDLAGRRVSAMTVIQGQNILAGFENGQLSALNYLGPGIAPPPGYPGLAAPTCMVEQPDGSLLIGSEEGLYRRKFFVLQRHGPLRGIRSIYTNGDGYTFIGTDRYVLRMDPSSFEMLGALNSESEVSALPGADFVWRGPAHAVWSKQGMTCWFGNQEGLFFHDGLETRQLAEESIRGEVNDITGFGKSITVSVIGRGIFLLDSDADQPHCSWSTASGLPTDVIYDLFAAGPKTLLAASNKGVIKISRPDPDSCGCTVVTHDQNDGLASNEVHEVESINGWIFAGTREGLSIYHQESFEPDSRSPGIYLTEVEAAGVEHWSEGIRLASNANALTLHFRTVTFNSPDLVTYRYRLSGYDDHWQSTSNGEVRYAALPPGKYNFEVLAVNKDGLASTESAVLPISIRPPLYKTWWFVLLSLVALVGLSVLTYHLLMAHYESNRLKVAVNEKTQQLDRKLTELRRSNDELEQFAYIASHDLKEPLRNISNYVQLIGRRYNGQLDDTGREYLDYVVGGVKRMYAMINGLLSYSDLVSQDISVGKVDMNALLDDVILEVTDNQPDKKVVVTKGDLPMVSANRGQIRELMSNLIDNGIKFNETERPSISVEGLDRDEEVEIRVRDNGVGLDEAYHEKVFQIFERLNNEAYPGSGIGLALCKKIVERHGGRIWYESNGHGSTFCFTLKKHLQRQETPAV